MQTTETKCDNCGKDLSDAGAMPTYALSLSPFAVRNSGGLIYSVAVLPPIDREHHFCNLACLDSWRDEERLFAGLMDSKWGAWKKEHADVSFGGAVTSYPSPGEEIYAAWVTECRAAAKANKRSTSLSA